MAADPLFDPADFRIPAGVTHVCAAGETPFLLRHDLALRRYAEDKSRGVAGREAQDAEIMLARDRVAASWGVEAPSIGFVGNVAEGVALVAESLDWRDGDNAVFDAAEYPSVVAPFALQRRPRIELRFAEGTESGRIAARVDARTRVIGVSYVSYLNGERFDLSFLREAADRVGALLLVDFTQAAGYLPIAAAVADFAFSACYKWLLGTTGVAIAYWNRDRQPGWQPSSAGWHSLASGNRPDYGVAVALRPDAFRLTRGNPAHAPAYVLASAFDYLGGFEIDQVTAHVMALADGLMRRLDGIGIATTTPRAPARHAGNVCIDSPDAAQIVERLQRHGVYCWNGRGRIRFSFHGYNGEADLDRIVAALDEAWPR